MLILVTHLTSRSALRGHLYRRYRNVLFTLLHSSQITNSPSKAITHPIKWCHHHNNRAITTLLPLIQMPWAQTQRPSFLAHSQANRLKMKWEMPSRQDRIHRILTWLPKKLTEWCTTMMLHNWLPWHPIPILRHKGIPYLTSASIIWLHLTKMDITILLLESTTPSRCSDPATCPRLSRPGRGKLMCHAMSLR